MTDPVVRPVLPGCQPSGFPTVDGHVVHPSYLPPGKREKFLAELREWVRTNQNRTLWPEWLRRFWKESEVEKLRREKRTAEGLRE